MTEMSRVQVRWIRLPNPGRGAPPLMDAGLGLGTPVMNIEVSPETGTVHVAIVNRSLTPDECRWIGVRLIEAAVLADAERSVRDQ